MAKSGLLCESFEWQKLARRNQNKDAIHHNKSCNSITSIVGHHNKDAKELQG